MKVIIYIVLFATISCSSNKISNLQNLYGKELVEPISAMHKIVYRNCPMQNAKIESFASRKHLKILAYYNEKGCTSCRLKELELWKSYIKDSIGSDSSKVEFIFILSNKLDILEHNLRLNRFEYPIICDVNCDFEKQNSLPSNGIFHYFLLDHNNKIVLIGSPLRNYRMWQLYKKRITELY